MLSILLDASTAVTVPTWYTITFILLVIGVGILLALAIFGGSWRRP